MRLKMMVLTLAVLCSLSFLAPLTSEAGVTVYVDGSQVTFDQQPFVDMQSKRTLVPFRQIFEALGAGVWYDEELNAAVGCTEDLTIVLPVNESFAVVNGEVIDLDTASKVVNGRTMVPIRFISEILGCDVQTDGNLSNLIIYISNTVPVYQPYDLGPGYSKSDLTLQQRNQFQEAINYLGPVPKDNITFSAIQPYYMEDGSLGVLVFIRNGYDYPVWNIAGTLDVVVGDEIIASGYFEFPDYEFGVLDSNMSRVWTLTFSPEYIFNYNDNLESYEINWDVEYNY